MSDEKYQQFLAAIDARIRAERERCPEISPYPWLAGFYEGVLPGVLSDEQADIIINLLLVRRMQA